MSETTTAPTPGGKYAVVEHGGHQFRVEEGDVFTVDRVVGEVGAKIDFGKPLLVKNAGQVTVGHPYVDKASVTATIVAHERGKKILVFKFKKCKNYRRKRGHRQELSRLKIETISAG